MLLRLISLSIILFLSGCIVITNNSTGTTKKLTLSGIETIEPMKEISRKKLPSLHIERSKDGFTANGVNYFDNAGSIIHLSEISDTGFVTYTIQGESKNKYIVKLVDPLKNDEPQNLGVLENKNDQWYYVLINGNRYNGEWFRLASRGVLLNSNDNIVTYLSPDQPVKNYTLPDGYSFTSIQKGDISQSKHILIQKLKEKKLLFGLISFETAALQLDLILFNIETGKATAKINDVRLRGKSNIENMAHLKSSYYLFNTINGTIVLTLEDGYQRFVSRNLTTGKTVVAFEREQGVSYTKAIMHSSGRIELTASIGLSNDKIIDLENFMLTGDKIKQLEGL
jgi:hypothetical protein